MFFISLVLAETIDIFAVNLKGYGKRLHNETNF